MEFDDRSGQPRSIRDIEEALHQARMSLTDTAFLASRPRLAVMLPTICDVLKEALVRRKSQRAGTEETATATTPENGSPSPE